MNIKWKTALTGWFMHFAVEVICFYSIYRLFDGGRYWWMMSILYDAFAFVPQAMVGNFCKKHPKLRMFPIGGASLIAGSCIMVFGQTLDNSIYFLPIEFVGLFFLTMGNCIMHIAGALRTLKVSEGRLSESAIFVGGGSFGVITGRLLSKKSGVYIFVLFLMALATALAELEMKRSKGDNDFSNQPCKHAIAANRPVAAIVIILGTIVIVRGYIGYGLPTAWNETMVQTVFLFVFMGLGKMSGGVLSDIFGARRVGIASCILAVPCLLISNHIMWLSLIGVAMFSMTMAVTLGGLVSVLKYDPGVAFGITTLGLFLGTAPIFFIKMPSRSACDILIVILSVLSAMGFAYCLKKEEKDKQEDVVNC